MKKYHFSKLARVWGILFLSVPSAIFITVDGIRSYSDFNSQAKHIREDYVDRQRQILKEEVMLTVLLIRHEKDRSEDLVRKKIKSRTDEAYTIARNIYQQNHPKETRENIRKMILDALRPIRFENGRGYFFATRLDGVEMLFADKPEMEGLNLLNMQDTHGQFVIQDMIHIANESGEGFYEYHWSKPIESGNNFKKISFIKMFEPLGWIIGTGLYVNDVDSEINQQLLSFISKIRFGEEGYDFVNGFGGDALVSNGQIFSGTKKLWEEFSDSPEKMKEIFDKEYHAALKPEGDYIHYSWIKLTAPDKISQKISFCYGMPDLQWLVGAGAYLDEIESLIASMQADLNQQMKVKLLTYISIFFGITSLFLIFFGSFSKKLKKDIQIFISFFEKASRSDEEIDGAHIRILEFDQMAEYANKMPTERKKAENALKESEGRFRMIFELSTVGKSLRHRMENSYKSTRRLPIRWAMRPKNFCGTT